MSQVEAAEGSKLSPSLTTTQSSTLIHSLNSEIKHLRKVVSLKDRALEEITAIIQSPIRQHSILASRQQQDNSKAPEDSRIGSSIEKNSETPNHSNPSNISQENAVENEEGATENPLLLSLREEIQRVVDRYSAAVAVVSAYQKHPQNI